ncbi:MAG: hypothetical protein QUT30_08015 [Acidobacteriota bacterium]|nr:hypothetical protein [Acidobacteriota bacterium]
MKAVVANHDLGLPKGDTYLLRGKGDWGRAFLLADHVVYDNAQIAETTHALLEIADLIVKSFVIEEMHFFVKVISEEITDAVEENAKNLHTSPLSISTSRANSYKGRADSSKSACGFRIFRKML